MNIYEATTIGSVKAVDGRAFEIVERSYYPGTKTLTVTLAIVLEADD